MALRIVFVFPVIALLAVWTCMAFWIDGPESRLLAGLCCGIFGITSAVLFYGVRPFGKALAFFAGLFAVVLLWWFSIPPSNDREWVPDVARTPYAIFDANTPDLVTIHNIRNFDYRSEFDYDEQWDTRSYDLSKIEGVDFYLVYWGSPMIAHTIVSWDFGDGRFLAVSIETRKEVGEEYSAILGFFRQFELYYVVADERDVVRLRSNYRGELVRRFRLTTPPEIAREVLLDYIATINRLHEEPHWYNAMTQNCTTTIRYHIKAVAPDNPFDIRILINGNLDELGYERGTIASDLPFEVLRERADITERAQAADDDPQFSLRIREDAS